MPRARTQEGEPRKAARVTVNLTPRSTRALDQAVSLTGDNQTDVINRALQVYDFLEQSRQRGQELYLQEPSTGARERVRFL